jgi:hypothetical protein
MEVPKSKGVTVLPSPPLSDTSDTEQNRYGRLRSAGTLGAGGGSTAGPGSEHRLGGRALHGTREPPARLRHGTRGDALPKSRRDRVTKPSQTTLEGGLWTDHIWVDYAGEIGSVEDDIITVWGTVTGSKSYKTQIGGENYVPRMRAKNPCGR